MADLRSIKEWFQNSPTPVFDYHQLRKLYAEQKRTWNLKEDTSLDDFPGFLTQHTKLTKVQLAAKGKESIVRYTWGEISPLTLAAYYTPRAYLSHGTAVFLHGLNDLIPRNVYVNKEQSKKEPPQHTPSQEAVDSAFRKPQRKSIPYTDGENTFFLLYGKNSDDYGVVQLPGPDGYALRVTGLERTLVDIAVRPAYSGGVFQVLEAYKTALPRISVKELHSTLRDLHYAYPYQQTIGFYLEKAECPKRELTRFRKTISEIDFYLDYDIPNNRREYDQSWNIFYPKGL